MGLHRKNKAAAKKEQQNQQQQQQQQGNPKNKSKKPTKKTTDQTDHTKRNNNKKNGRRIPQPELPPGALDDDDDDEEGYTVTTEDAETFAEYGNYIEGLVAMDVKGLIKKTTQPKTTPTVKPAPVPNSSEISDIEEEEEVDDWETDDEPKTEEEEEEEREYIPKPKKRKTGEDDEEQEYEILPRTVQQPKENCFSTGDSTRLPIKLADGRVRLQQKVAVAQCEESEESEVEVEEEKKEEEEEEESEEEDEAEEDVPVVSRNVHVAQKKEELALIAQSVVEDPESNVDQLKKLRVISKDKDPKVVKLAFLAQFTVYKDIIPGYRIRSVSQKEAEGPISKQVKKLRKFEEALLTQYQNYLQSLESVMNAKDGNQSIAMVAAQCMCGLLDAVPHFNFRVNLMTAIVGRLAAKKNNDIFNLCCKCIADTFDNDLSGEASLEAIRLITKMIKSRGYIVRQEVLETFLHLRLRGEMAPPKSRYEKPEPKPKGGFLGRKRARMEEKKSAGHLSRKSRKLAKLGKEVAKEMKEAEAEISKEEKEKNQTETLQHVFVCYFRILKHAQASPLLPAVLEGLSKFAHLINVDFFADLLAVLKHIMISGGAGANASNQSQQSSSETSTSSRTATRCSLLCVITAFQLLSGQGETLNIDLRDFYTQLYALLPKLALDTGVESHRMVAIGMDDEDREEAEDESLRKRKGSIVRDFKSDELKVPSMMELVLRGFDLLFLKRRQIPAERVAAFMKRLATVALQLPAQSVLECLRVINDLLLKFPKCDQLLSPDDDRTINGIYRPELDDPEACNPFATSLWELDVLANHYDVRVKSAAVELVKRVRS